MKTSLVKLQTAAVQAFIYLEDLFKNYSSICQLSRQIISRQ